MDDDPGVAFVTVVAVVAVIVGASPPPFPARPPPRGGDASVDKAVQNETVGEL
jgi:hypothetical protein